MNQYAIDQLAAQIETGRARLAAGASDLPERVLPLWETVTAELDAAVAASEPVERQIRRIWGRLEYTIEARAEQTRARMVALNDEVNARLQKCDRTLADIAFALQEGIMPPRPEGVSQLEVVDRKEDIRRLLERHGGAGAVLEEVVTLMRDAIREHDALTAYCLTPDGPLSWTYKLLSVDRPRLRSALYRAIREASRESVPGEGLLRCYEASHEDLTSWVQLQTAISGLVNAVGEGAAGLQRAHAMHEFGHGTRGDAEVVRERQRAVAGVVADRQQALAHQDQAAATVDLSGGGDLSAVLEASRVPRE